MHYLFVYHGGVVPEDQAEQNISDLWNWLDNLKARGYEKVRFAGFGRKTVSPHAVEDYQGDIFGVSVMEAESLEEAVSLTTDWPELQYGGKIEVFEALAADYPRSSSDAHILNLFADVSKFWILCTGCLRTNLTIFPRDSETTCVGKPDMC